MKAPKAPRQKKASSSSDQIQKFREAARDVETDNGEAALDRYIKQVAKAAPKEAVAKAGKKEKG